MDIDQLLDFNKRIFSLQDEKKKILTTYQQVVDEYAKCRSEVRNKLREHFKDAQDNTKKTAGIDILELFVANKCPEIAEAYRTYTYLEPKKNMLSMMLESLNQDMSAIQSEMKFIRQGEGI